ncbi:hypothetical protein RhiirA5_442668 [Rhizophagus irregularis]|uniref:Uncharacterized protein n=1 Tax=Rhizophagus irregularis TaxID=588596 RepID=A0A2N0NEQ1_9GLOM|nr:hypothetical protein RhiirA5_442668 [Rhizophagus irregularis]
MYGTLHGTYKKALQKALQTKSSSLHLIEILEDFANEDNEFESEDEELGEKESDDSDKENINVVQLQNPKLKRGKGRLVGTKRYKASLKLPAETLQAIVKMSKLKPVKILKC